MRKQKKRKWSPVYCFWGSSQLSDHPRHWAAPFFAFCHFHWAWCSVWGRSHWSPGVWLAASPQGRRSLDVAGTGCSSSEAPSVGSTQTPLVHPHSGTFHLLQKKNQLHAIMYTCHYTIAGILFINLYILFCYNISKIVKIQYIHTLMGEMKFDLLTTLFWYGLCSHIRKMFS